MKGNELALAEEIDGGGCQALPALPLHSLHWVFLPSSWYRALLQ